MKQSKLTDQDKENIVELYKNGYSTRAIEKLSPVKRTAIIKVLDEAGISRKTTGNSYKLRKYNLNENYFDTINTEEKAYWLGFILADGYVGTDGLTLVLKESDKTHLELFLKSIESNHKISYRSTTKSYVVSLYSYHLRDSLRKYGMTRNKSKDAVVPDVPKKFIKSILRGVFDGDGSIGIGKNTYVKGKYPNFQVNMCGTEKVVEWFMSTVSKELNINKCKIQKYKTGFCIGGWGGNRQCLLILDWMYGDSNIYLNRKYERYLALKSFRNNL